jgi:20S proteasome alpha/beta subunit
MEGAMIPPFQKPSPQFPSKPFPGPKPKRLLKGKPMTLVAAFRCPNGGILLCADREENDGYTRREVDKIYKINLNPCQVFLAGAGPSGVITNAHSHIHGALVQAFSDNVNILNEHKNIIEVALKKFHKRYASNLKSGYLDLLIIFAPLVEGNVPILYRTEAAMMVPEPYYAAYGSAKGMCDYFADRLYEYGKLDKNSMKILAAFILREAEKSTAGVGIGNDMWFIHEGDKSVHILPNGPIQWIQQAIPPLSESLWSDWKSKVSLPKHFSG